MFHKLKQFKDMRDRAKTLQSALSEITVTASRNGHTLTMDGNQKVISLKLSPEAKPADLERDLPPLIDDAIRRAQRAMVEHAQRQGGLEGLRP